MSVYHAHQLWTAFMLESPQVGIDNLAAWFIL